MPDDDLDFGQTIRGFAEAQKVFGRYTLRHILGRGGMGIVWLAWDETLEEQVALKFMPEMVRLDAMAIQDLVKETRKSRQLTHQYIVRIHDFLEDSQTAAIAMEFVDGATMSAFRLAQHDQVFSIPALGVWLRQLTAALTYAHETVGLVHRDIKPSNLMVDTRGDIKITDFGISSSLTDSMSRVSVRTDSSGSPPYMSPQQLMGETPRVTDDIYSLGATFYELITGKPPFYRGNIPSQVQSVTPPPMAERRAEIQPDAVEEIPAAWEDMIRACLEKNPAKRPQSIKEMEERLVSGPPPGQPTLRKESKPLPMLPELPVHRRGRGVFIGVAILMLLAILGAAGWYFGIHLPAEQARRIKQIHLAEQSRLAEQAQLAEQARLAEIAQKEKKAREAKAAKEEAERQKVAAKAAAEAEAAAAAIRSAAFVNGKPWTNSLGMKFVPIPGIPPLFSVYETRVGDFETFVEATGYDAVGPDAWTLGKMQVFKQKGGSWMDPHFDQSPNHPVTCVNIRDAEAFCEWLTKKERDGGLLPPGASYRLPTDAEWSVAVGLGREEEVAGSPKSKSGKVDYTFPWGKRWPPVGKVGNFWGNETGDSPIEGYTDEHFETAPVGSYRRSALGLYDISGNVAEWCSDFYEPGSTEGVVRGGSWSSMYENELLSTARESLENKSYRASTVGFRVVLNP